MLRVLTCIAFEHSWGLVALAALICTIGATVSAHLLRKAIIVQSKARFAWGFIGAIAAGSTIWCTHFVAMLAYNPGIPIGYESGATMMSLFVAIVGSAAAFGLASERFKYSAETGGAVFGAAISGMHYCGMLAITTNGQIVWHMNYVFASVVLAIALSALAFNRLAKLHGKISILAGSSAMVLAIVSLHFTGMAALEITPFAALEGQETMESARSMIAVSVTGVGLLVLAVGAMAYFLDAQARAYASARLRHFGESAVDGMAITRDGKLQAANSEFLRLVGFKEEDIVGSPIDRFLVDVDKEHEGTLITTQLRQADGDNLPVELTIQTEPKSDDGAPMTVYALRDISQRLAHEKKISFLAQYDSLTGLRNRSTFLEHATSILDWGTKGEQFAVIAIDLDRFKEINDTYGHAAGDVVLRKVGERLKAHLENHQFAARLGGDEFVVFSSIENKEDASELAEQLHKVLMQAIDFEGVQLFCGASFGVSMFPEDGQQINTLLNNADLAMYRAKSSDNTQICFYDKGMDDSVRKRRSLVDGLRTAIKDNQLELHYQVQMKVPDETISGYEALVRWNHPTRGLIGPNVFIPLAEQTGLIVALGEWVLRQACFEAASWEQEYDVSVNLSPVQLMDPSLLETIQDVLLETGLAPNRLELEVTETSFVTDQAKAISVLEQIRALGVSISIDDFGTGYSSLAMLRAFPFDKIKLDKSLIDDIERNQKSRGVFCAVLSLGDALSVPILAEGVENKEQLSFLLEHGCQFVQGYYYGKPELPSNPLDTSAIPMVKRKSIL